MSLNSNRIRLLILAVTSILLTRAVLVLFDDPEGPNLLIIGVGAAVVFALSSAAYLLNISGTKKFVLAVLIQVVLVTGFYYFG